MDLNWFMVNKLKDSINTNKVDINEKCILRDPRCI